MPVRPARRERRLPDRMTRLMLLLAHWTDYPPPGAGPRAAGRGAPGPAGSGIRRICDAYRLDGRDEIVDVIMWWQDRCWRGIQAGAEAGEEAMLRLRDSGAVREVRAAFGWVAAHRSGLEVS